MPTLEEVQALAIWCGAILALAAVVGLVWKLVRRMWKIFDTAKRVSEQILGTPAVTLPDGTVIPARPGYNERLNRIEETQQRIEAAQRDIVARIDGHTHDDGSSHNGVADLRRHRRR